MDKITPHLWYDTQAVEAAELYTATFPGSKITDVTTLHDTPSGDCDVVSFELFGQGFMAISAGPLFTFNPSISFLVRCESEEEVDAYWRVLGEGGSALMPLDAYPFSKRYGWTQDRYGLSWQVMLVDREPDRRITPMLMFVGDACGKAEEAISFYTSVFRDASVGQIDRWGTGDEPERPGSIKFAEFTLEGQGFAAMESGGPHKFGFNEAISLLVSCDTQDEIDYYWDRLSVVPESEQCGWLKDRFGVSWQVSPRALDEMLRDGTPDQVARVTQSFLQMKKFDLSELRRAYDGT
jgi:predicted 3-demethylubiquinone-9 3-methyltransferase (glyoxalase superfamily)